MLYWRQIAGSNNFPTEFFQLKIFQILKRPNDVLENVGMSRLKGYEGVSKTGENQRFFNTIISGAA